MGEWKRVFINPRRLALWGIMAVLCAGLFLLSLCGRLAPGEVERTISAGRYAQQLADSWRDRPVEDLPGLVKTEWRRLSSLALWYNGDEFASQFCATEAEALAAASDLPRLTESYQARDDDEFYNTLKAYESALVEMEEEALHLAGYREYLTGIRDQAERQSQSSIFGRPGSFAYRNLDKTAADFAPILDVPVSFGGSLALRHWLGFRLGDYFHLLAVIVLVLAFLEERKSGLWPAVRTTRGGRSRLGLRRAAMVLAGSAAATALFCALPFFLSMAVYGGWEDLTRSLQSLTAFGSCPLPLTILGWLLRYAVVKTLAGALVGLLLWCLLGTVTDPQFNLAVLGAFLAAEYALYKFLPVQSLLNGLKYGNVFAYVHTADLYTHYLNIDLFGFPVGIRDLALWGLPILGGLFTLWAVGNQSRRYPQGNRDLLGRIAAPVNRGLDVLRRRLSLSGWEGYKALIFQRGVLLLVLVYLVCGQMVFLYATTADDTSLYAQYCKDMQGPLDASADDYLARAREKALGTQEEGQLLFALDRVEDRVDALRKRAEAGGYEPWMVQERSYDIAYGPESLYLQRTNGAAAVLLTTLLAVPLWAFERQAGVAPMVRSTRRGRRGLFRRKAAIAALMGAFVWACVYLRELAFFLREHPSPPPLAAAVQNVDALASFPLAINFGQYLVILYALRLLMLIGVGEVSMALGLLCPNVRMSYAAGALLLGLPALLTAMGVGLLAWTSPLVPVASAELLWSMGGGSLVSVLPWLAWAAVSLAAAWACRRKWVGAQLAR